MKIKARRGVCIGVDRHLAPGDLADLDAAQVQFLVSIGAVEPVVDEAPSAPAPEPVTVPVVPDGTSDEGGSSDEPDASEAGSRKKRRQ